MRSNEKIALSGAKTQEEALRLGKYLEKHRHRCSVCKKLSYFTHSINGAEWVCYDGHFSTTGTDNRTINGKPLWLGNKAKGKIEFGVLI
jgi:hypothetical protein